MMKLIIIIILMSYVFRLGRIKIVIHLKKEGKIKYILRVSMRFQ